jgi:hypothetical protein
VIKVHNETSSSIRRIDRGCSFAHALSYFRKNLAIYFDSVPAALHPRACRKREWLNETLQISYPKKPMDRPAAPTPNHRNNAPQAANLGEFSERSAFWK